jgi:serine/threonine-protein kinase
MSTEKPIAKPGAKAPANKSDQTKPPAKPVSAKVPAKTQLAAKQAKLTELKSAAQATQPPVKGGKETVPPKPQTQPASPKQAPAKLPVKQPAAKVPAKAAATPVAIRPATEDQAAKSASGEKSATTLGKYKLLKKLGQGGMGAVYKAQQTGLDRIVAVKVLSKELSSKQAYVDRFKREASVMAKLNHPHILGCIDRGQERDYHFIVMEFIEGGSVEGWLKKLGKFELGDALHIILKTAEGLRYAHEKKMIHRDIKPDNILLTKDGIVKIADLGLAKDTEEDVSLTKTGAGAGTPIYMAPEQARDVKHVDSRTDIYALGVMLYVFLTGQAPFAGATLVEVISAKEKGTFDPIRKHNPDVPPKIDLICSKMMSKELKYRYATCAEVIEALEPLGLANEQLSFVEAKTPVSQSPTAVVKKPAKPQGTQMPAQGIAKTKAPTPAKKTNPPAGKTNVVEDEENDPDIWFMNIKSPAGKVITKKVTTDQLRTLIKAGHIDADTQLSRTQKAGFRAAGTFPEFQGLFKAREASDKAKAKGKNYDQMYKDLAAQDESRKRWGWLSRGVSGFLRLAVGLLVILAVLGGLGFGGWWVWENYLK